ncbi:protein LURP-one-related 15-like isoform X1 [Salvia miltiorrhiza]|uniref:protein LURP-one-related 15-like isoform X1 n=1 Tax=Salvia miltiorrhiza TaxID=226208 RepID=UPI0025AD8AD7|nr:protein LURP-one-related 15-like isoform X1 [Salvia miltiorrhiza]
MMGGASYPAVEVAVVSPQFCVSYPVDLIVTRKLMTLEDGTFGVTDVNGNLLFRIRGKVFSLHDRRVLLDAAGNPIITFQQKLLTAHRRWQAFRGESTDSKNMLFNVRKSSMIQFKTKLDVFMAANSKEDRCDFRIEGSWFERSCAIYAGDTNNVIAQVRSKLNTLIFSILCCVLISHFESSLNRLIKRVFSYVYFEELTIPYMFISL